MKYYKKLKVFKSKQCTFDPFAMNAYSYDWWKFVECRQGYGVIFNWARYSMQTSKQQAMVKDVMKALGIKSKYVNVKAGLQNITGEIRNIEFKIKEIREAIAKPKSRAATNEDRLDMIEELKARIAQLKRLNKAKIIPYKGKLRFDNLPKPEPMSDEAKARRAERKAAKIQLREHVVAMRTEQAQVNERRSQFKLVMGERN